MWLRQNQAWLWFLIGLITILLAFLVGPRIPDDRQADMFVLNVHLSGPFGLSLNGDSAEFLRLATHPTALLEPQNLRQSRPGLIIAAAVLALPLSPLRGVVARLGLQAERADIDPGRISNALASGAPAFAAYLLLNVMLLAAAFGCLMKICGPRANAPETIVVVAAGLLLLANDVVKVFVWSPHTQIFNIVVPTLAVYAALRAWSDGLGDRRYAIVMGAAIGIGFTAYPLFAVIVLCLVLPALARSVRLPWQEGRARLANIAIVTGLSVLPYAAWFLFVRFKTGAFYSQEVEEVRLVVWMKDAWAQGATALAADLAQRLGLLIKLAAPQAFAAAAMFAWVLTLAIFGARRAQLRPALQVINAGLLVSALVAVFYTCVGFIISRLAYATVPPLIAIAGAVGVSSARQVSPRTGWLLAVGCLAIAIAQVLVTVIKAPPRL